MTADGPAHPERVRRLVLYGGYGAGSGIADSRARAEIPRLVRDTFAGLASGEPAWIAALDRGLASAATAGGTTAG